MCLFSILFTIGIRGCAAPGGCEASGVGTGVVDNSLVDEGELAGGGAGGGRCGGGGGGGGGWDRAGVGVAISIVANHVVTVDISLGGAPRRIESSSIGTAGVGHTLYNGVRII